MTDATCGATAVLRPPQARKPDALLSLTRLDQYRRSARRRRHYELAADPREARRLLLAFRMDEEYWRRS
jgi:hypothetical protein